MKLRSIALLAISLSCAAGANAQSTPPAEQTRVTPLAPVVVTATRVPGDPLLLPTAIDAINADEIRRAQPRLDVGEALQRVPGVVARDRQNQAQDLQLSIRGFGARAAFGVRGVRLYTDGIPATMPDGQGQLSHFPLESAARIEVLRGPFSVLYGNAAGGVVSLYTATAPTAPVAVLGVTFGEDALRRESLSLQAPWREDGDALVDIVRIVGDGYRMHSASQRRSGQMLLRGGWGRDGRFTALFNHFDLVADDPQGLSAAQLAGDRRAASAGAITFDTRKTVRQDQAGFRMDHAISETTTLVATAWKGSRKTFQMLSVPVAVQRASARHSGGAIDLDRDYGGIDARIRWTGTFFDTPLAFTAGVDDEVAEERRRGFENFVGNRLGVVGALRRDEENRVQSRDVYLQAEWTPAPRWRIHAGLRHGEVRFVSRDHFVTSVNPDDSGSVAYASSSPAMGVLFRATPWLSVYANQGNGFETPTFSEL
ncbi:MAG: TonB-dependent receptor, partial [Thermomonas sp.]